MSFRAVTLVLLACLLGAGPAGAQQPQPQQRPQVNLEPLRGEWLGKVDALASASDPGMRGFRLWAPRGITGAGARYVINGVSDTELLRPRIGAGAISFNPKEGGTVSLRVTSPNEMTGTWTTAQGAASQVRFRRSEPTTTFDREYSGRGQDRYSQCVHLLAKLQVRNGRVSGTFEQSTVDFKETLDSLGDVWSSGEVDIIVFTTTGTVAWHVSGRIENGRMKLSLRPGRASCGELLFDLR